MRIFINIISEAIEKTKYPRPSDPESGALIEFHGVVRDSEDGKPIKGIEYEAFSEMAHHQLELLAEKYSATYRLDDFLCIHRIGYVPAGEASLYIRISSGHRHEAFSAITAFIDDLKKIVPIWKHPVANGE